MVESLKVLSLSPEVEPYAKTGGLADVASALPRALKRLGADMRLMLPFYRIVREGNFEIYPLLNDLEVPLGNEILKANVLEIKTGDDIPVYLIERGDMYDRPGIYGNLSGDYYDNFERYTFYAHAVFKAAESLLMKPDVIHCHDWQTGLVPALLKGTYARSSSFRKTASVFTIHNIGYQGTFSPEKLPITGLPAEEFYHPEGLEYWGKISLLKSGIVYADAITTVSPKYAREIQTSDYGMGMEGILQIRKDVLYGVLNGIDEDHWGPAKDRYLPAKYSFKSLAGKHRCKESLIEEMGLDSSLMDSPLLGVVSRLDPQKGIDILLEILEEIFIEKAGLVLLGSGDEKIEKAIRDAAKHFPGRLGFKFGFDESLAHRIMAGADIFLIPSRYEPCGLTQMYALKYGTVPVVRATGGLDDTVRQFNPDTKEGNGFKFEPFESEAFLAATREAFNLFKAKRDWKSLMTNGMKGDFSWHRSARRYLQIYHSVLKGNTSKM